MRKKKNIIKRFFLFGLMLLIFFLNRNRIFNITKVMLSDINFKLVDTKTLIYNSYMKYNQKLDYLRNVKENVDELEKLKSEIQLLTAEKMELQKIVEENIELRTYLELENTDNKNFVVAEVILKDNLQDQDIIYINKGKNQGITENSPVILNGKLIGKINKVSEKYSEVYLLSNPNFKMSVNVNNIFTGIIRGKGSLNFVIKNFNVENSEKIFQFDIETSGISELYPKGLPIGSFRLEDKTKLIDNKELNFTISDRIIGINTVVVYQYDNNKLKLLKEIEGEENR
ncbi:rod shape-determining protein MreC [Streptobacillus felis]|uniref:Rod shape-determining protein MreC n=1 Tax=Streptobacillus felis TaxID=1384509 RepID=A0A7Z0T9S2_9FUSO|nr:rod shape-determining protein MreC [Streptobacillus felis]NYV27217.1 rod shape-determining protein MreC [Streptobacillus felis]